MEAVYCKITVSIELVSAEALLQRKMQLEVLGSIWSRNFVNLSHISLLYMQFYIKTLYLIQIISSLSCAHDWTH